MITRFDKLMLETKWLPVKTLSIIWAGSQREYKERDAQKIADNFDPEQFGQIVVTRPNGKGIYHIIDGQHRVGAVLRLWGGDEQVPCVEIPVADPKRAAEMFDKINTGRRPVPAIEKFLVRVEAEYEMQVAIFNICAKLGYKIRKLVGDGDVQAVGALEHLYQAHGGECLKNTLSIIQATWGKDKNAVAGPIITGFGLVISGYPHANWQRLKDRVSRKFTPGRLLGAARSYREIQRVSMGEAVKSTIVACYNAGIKSGKLK